MPVIRFKFFGVPIQVLPGYWLFTALLCFGGPNAHVSDGFATLAMMFLSVLTHELGHAAAARYFGISSVITLHTLGGITAFPSATHLTRKRDIVISLAGPLAGLLLGSAAWLGLVLLRQTPSEQRLNLPAVLQGLAWINFFWSSVNLLPVIPFDGGRILAAALGPQRRQLAMALSFGAAVLAAIGLAYAGYPLGAVLFGSSALSSAIQWFRELRRPAPLPLSKIDETLQLAKRALDHGLWDRAEQLSSVVLTAGPPLDGARKAWETLLWSRLGRGDSRGAHAALSVVQAGLDPYLVAAIANEAGRPAEARLALETARAAGDTRIEVTALLIRVLLALGDATSASELTSGVLEQLPLADVRKVVEECERLGALRAAGVLCLELAKRSLNAEDAALALRLFSEHGDVGEAEDARKLAEGLAPEPAR